MKNATLLFLTLVLPLAAQAGPQGVIVHAVEFGIGKFHRQDNKVHRYGSNNVWANYILPERATVERQLTQRNRDGSYTIFFSAAEEMIQTVAQIARQERRPVAILNLEAHGLPGGMWYPIDAEARDGEECSEWVDAASGPDRDNYTQYYSATTKEEILEFRKYAQAATHRPQPCNSGITEWKRIIRRNPAFVAALANDAEFHFVSCIVGLGLTGENFTRGLAEALFAGRQGKVVTSINYGLGDWSIPEGMGFWDYIDDRQIARDNAIYPRNRSDRDIMQPGKVRVATVTGARTSSVVHGGVEVFYPNNFADEQEFKQGFVDTRPEPAPVSHAGKLSSSARIPGTKQFVDLNR